MLLSDTERQTLEDLQTGVAFFVNGCVAIVVLGGLLVVDALLHTSELELALRVSACLVGAAVLFAFFYSYAIQAVVNWGTAVRAAFDLHRFELFTHLGLKAPTTHAEEKELGRVINRGLLFAEPFPDAWRSR